MTALTNLLAKILSRRKFEKLANTAHERTVSKDFQEVLIFDPTSSFCDSNACYGYREGYCYSTGMRIT